MDQAYFPFTSWNWPRHLLEQPWFGNAIGAAIGLIALAVAAFLNAHLNRARDDRLRRREVDALRAAIGTELRAYSRTLADRFGYLKLIAERNQLPPRDELVERLSLPEAVIYPAVASKIGELRPREAIAISLAWHEVSLVRNLLSATLVNPRPGEVDLAAMIKRAGYGLDAAATCAVTADQLLGPEPILPIPQATAEEAREILSGRSGGRWIRYQRAEHERRYGKSQPTS